MTHALRKVFQAASAAVALLAAPAAIAQTHQGTGSILSDMSDPELQARYRKAAEAMIACPPVVGYDAKWAAYQKAALAKWDRAGMGCAAEYGAEAVSELSVPSSALWALVTFRVDNIERNLEVLGANLEFFDVLSRTYSDHYQGIELSSELSLRWERTRSRCEEILARVGPLEDDVVEVRILRAAFLLVSTARETPTDQQNAAVAAAIEDLEIAIREKPEALDGLSQLLLGQVLLALPEFLGGDPIRAIDLLEEANRLDPDNLAVHRQLVEAYIGERENEKAKSLLIAALSADPEGMNKQDYVDELVFLTGFAQRLGDEELAGKLAASRDAVLAAHSFLLSRKEFASFGHGGEDPITGRDPAEVVNHSSE